MNSDHVSNPSIYRPVINPTYLSAFVNLKMGLKYIFNFSPPTEIIFWGLAVFWGSETPNLKKRK